MTVKLNDQPCMERSRTSRVGLLRTSSGRAGFTSHERDTSQPNEAALAGLCRGLSSSHSEKGGGACWGREDTVAGKPGRPPQPAAPPRDLAGPAGGRLPAPRKPCKQPPRSVISRSASPLLPGYLGRVGGCDFSAWKEVWFASSQLLFESPTPICHSDLSQYSGRGNSPDGGAAGRKPI